MVLNAKFPPWMTKQWCKLKLRRDARGCTSIAVAALITVSKNHEAQAPGKPM
jgi:hypothetical protein